MGSAAKEEKQPLSREAKDVASESTNEPGDDGDLTNEDTKRLQRIVKTE